MPLIFIFISLLSIPLIAQPGRYQKAIFADRNVQSNIQYGSADRYDIFGFDNPQPLRLDFYEPTGDTATKRPLVLVFFGGGYLIGDKIMQDMVGWCDSLTAYGYACAAVNYRIGYNVLNDGSAIRAGYRGLQDARAAIRYLKEYHQQFRIDTNYIYLGGNSAGAIISIQVAYGEESDRPAETYGISGTLDDNSDLGCMDCSGNSYQHSIDIAGIIGCWGAVIDMNGLDSSDTAPLIMFHGTNDNIVPIDSGAAFNANGAFPPIYGSRTIHNARTAMGLASELHVYEGQPHNFYYNGAFFPGIYWDSVWQLTHPFLCSTLPYCSTNVSTQTVENSFGLQLFPNPSHQKITLKIDYKALIEPHKIAVYNALGSCIYTDKTLLNDYSIDIANWASGLYFLSLETNGSSISKSFQVRH